MGRFAAAVAIAALIPVASAGVFPVNTHTTGWQGSPRIANLASGGFVVTWTGGDDQDGDGLGVFARLFDAMGSPLTTELPVNASTAGDQRDSGVAAMPDGGFVVVWQHGSAMGSSSEIRARRFAPDGAAVWDEVAVAGPLPSSSAPAAATTSDGILIVAWAVRPDPSDWHFWGCAARVFGPDGAPVGDEFEVAAPAPSQSYWSLTGVETLGDGRFAVVWSHDDRIHARILHLSGGAVTSPFQVSSPDDPWPYHDYLAEVDADASGDFVVAWSREITLGPTGSHYASRFTRDGNHVWTVEPVWYYAGMGGQGFSMTPAGEFVDVWGDLVGAGMEAGCFTASGESAFEPWVLGSGGEGSHSGFRVDHQDDSNPHFVVVWQGHGDVFGMRNLRLFADGFEGEDLAYWTESQPE